jgi:hypothetical protein
MTVERPRKLKCATCLEFLECYYNEWLEKWFCAACTPVKEKKQENEDE